MSQFVYGVVFRFTRQREIAVKRMRGKQRQHHNVDDYLYPDLMLTVELRWPDSSQIRQLSELNTFSYLMKTCKHFY